MGFTWGVCSSRLTLKRHKARREEGRPYVPNLGQLIREIQREAAALPTDALRDEIEINLEVQDAAIDQYFAHPARSRDGRRPDHRQQRGHGVRADDRPVRAGTGFPPGNRASRSLSVPTSPDNAGARRSCPLLARLGPRVPRNAHNLSERKLRHAQL